MTELARFLPFINILFYSAALKWVLNLEKYQCKCSADKRRDIMDREAKRDVAREIADAVAAQIRTLETYSTFDPFSNDVAERLAPRQEREVHQHGHADHLRAARLGGAAER